MIERERRFLVESLPEPLPEPNRIEQAYVSTGPASVRVRRIDDKHILTVKTGSGRNRHEIERDLTQEEFGRSGTRRPSCGSRRRHRV